MSGHRLFDSLLSVLGTLFGKSALIESHHCRTASVSSTDYADRPSL